MLTLFYLLSALAGDMWIYALLSLRTRKQAPSRRTYLLVMLFLAVATRLQAVAVAIIMLLPVYLLWLVAAAASGRRAGPIFGAICSALFALYFCLFLIVFEPTFAFPRPSPAMWFFNLTGDLLPALLMLAPAASAREALQQVEELIVLSYVYLPSIVIGMAPLLGLILQHRWIENAASRSETLWFGPPTSLAMLGLLLASLAWPEVAPSPERSIFDLELSGPLTMRGADVLSGLGRAFITHGDVAALVYFALLPFAVFRVRFIPLAVILGFVLGTAALQGLAAVGIALALLGWLRRPGDRREGSRLSLLPRPMGRGYLTAAYVIGFLLLVSLTFNDPWNPALGPLSSEEMRSPVGNNRCADEPGGMRRFQRFAIACSEANWSKGTLGGLTPESAEAHCASQGMRVCSEQEWVAACQGPLGHYFPSPANYGPDDYPPAICPRLKGAALPADLPAACVTNSGLYGMVGSYVEWVRDGKGDYVLKGRALRGSGGLASRCDMHMRIRFPERYQQLLDYSYLGTRCCAE